MAEQTPSITALRSDKDKAEDLRKRMLEALEGVVGIMKEAHASNLVINFQIAPVDHFGRAAIVSLDVFKRLA